MPHIHSSYILNTVSLTDSVESLIASSGCYSDLVITPVSVFSPSLYQAGKAPVVLRAAVFVECAHFVHQLRHSHKTAWLLANYKKSRNVLHNIRRWGEVLGLKLKKILDREKQFSVSLE